MYDVILAGKLKKAREKSGLKEWQVAYKLGIETRLITQFENATRKPFPDILRKLEKIYHCSFD